MTWLVLVLLAQLTTASGSGTTVTTGTGTTKSVTRYLLLFGDSKTADNGATVNTWPLSLQNQAETSTGYAWSRINQGVGGRTVATTATAIVAMLANLPALPNATDIRATINLGVNDETTGLPAQGAWETDYLTILDAMHVKWPIAKIYLVKVWQSGFDTDSDTIATRIGHLVAARPSFVFAGPDERVWLKGADNGVAETTDGTHYSRYVGNALAVTAWTAVLFP